MVWLPVFRIFNMRTDADSGNYTQGLSGHRNRVCTDWTLGEKSLAALGNRTSIRIALGFSAGCSTNSATELSHPYGNGFTPSLIAHCAHSHFFSPIFLSQLQDNLLLFIIWYPCHFCYHGLLKVWAATLVACRRFGNRRLHYAGSDTHLNRNTCSLNYFGTFPVNSFPCCFQWK